MRSTPWYRLSTVFAVAGILILAGCGEDTPTSDPDAPADDPTVDPVVRTALEAFEAARDHLQETVYDDLDIHVIVDGDTLPASADLASLVALRAVWIPGNELMGEVGHAVNAPWFASLLDTTRLRTKLSGEKMATRYDVDLDPMGTITVQTVEVSDIEFRNGGDSYYMDAVDVDSDVVIATVLSDTASAASMAVEHILDLLDDEFYIVMPDTYYTAVDTFWLPPDEMTEVVDGGETFYEFTRYTEQAGGEVVRYAASSFVQNTDYLDAVNPVVFDANETVAGRQAIFEAGEDIADFTGPASKVLEIRTTSGQEDPSLVALYRVEAVGDKTGIRWAEIDPDLVDGEVYPDTVIELEDDQVEFHCPGEDPWTQSASKPCACLPDMLINGDHYLVIVNLGAGAVTYDSDGHWTLDRPDGQMLLSHELFDGSFELGGSEITMLEIDSFDVPDEPETVWVDPTDLGIDSLGLGILQDLTLDFPEGIDELNWRIETQIVDQLFNELLVGDPVVDWISAVADTSSE